MSTNPHHMTDLSTNPSLYQQDSCHAGSAKEGDLCRDILGYEGLYKVSNLGVIKSTQRHGTLFGGNIMKHRINDCGYMVVYLSKNNICREKKVHRIMAQAFISNPKNKPQVNHKNGINTDNRLENLEWCTAKENMCHAFNTGLACGRPRKK